MVESPSTTIARFESAHRITLPADYRAFLAGSDAPSGMACEPGMLPAAMSGWLRTLWLGVPRLDHPFPFSQPWTWTDDETPPDLRALARIADGTLPLGAEGCGQYALLVVTGPERGAVWLLTDVGIAPVATSFREWIADMSWPITRRAHGRPFHPQDAR